MESMYDRLGDLLNKALETGEFPGNKEPSIGENEDQTDTAYKAAPENAGHTVSEQGRNNTRQVVSSNKIKRDIPQKVINAFGILGLNTDVTIVNCKKAYRKKLKRYHPDNNSINPIVQKVAAKKTDELITAYQIACAWLEK
jgi:hypothetical protein